MKKTRQKINGTTQAATFESHSVRAHSFAMDREKNNQLYTDRLFKHISDRERTNELKESDKIQIKQNRERKRERKKTTIRNNRRIEYGSEMSRDWFQTSRVLGK
jgi:hypothetical protein